MNLWKKRSTADSATNPDGTPKTPVPPRDTTREVFETVVFVVVLVLMLKLFVAEAFVIPTGSMASTLWGDQVRCVCRECGHKFPINASNGGKRAVVGDYLCENCGFRFSRWFDEKHPGVRESRVWEEKYQKELEKDVSSVSSGDRVLVAKYLYHLAPPRRFEVPVFKFPKEPYSIEERQGMNYIKRLVGLSGETLAVFNGDLYTTRALDYAHIPPADRPERELDAWWPRYMYPNDPVAIERFQQGKFDIVRKTPDEILAVRRIVFDLDQQPKSIQGVRRVRWHPQGNQGIGWRMDEAGFTHAGGDLSWMCYQHLNPWDNEGPYYIDDYLGYNTRDHSQPFNNRLFTPNDDGANAWVSDLALDCVVEISSADVEIALELSKGKDRARATFVNGQCKLALITTLESGEESVRELGSQPTKMTSKGTYNLRLANFDARMTVWVDGKPIAYPREQSDYAPVDPTTQARPFDKNDLLRPARVGARGEVKVSGVRLWRDLQYRAGWPARNPQAREEDILQFQREWKGQPPKYTDLQTYYVQPGHYLMFGDNVNSSADSRTWGQVPDRLMLGRAVVVYWPFARMGVIE
jgi:signal peptidase I